MTWSGAVAQTQAHLALLAVQMAAAGGLLLIGLPLALFGRWVTGWILRHRRMAAGPAWSRIAPSLVFFGVFSLALIGALWVFGVATSWIGAVIGFAATLGLAADIYAGLQVLESEHFKVGDFIEVPGDTAASGLIVQKSLYTLSLQTEDGREYVIPVKTLLTKVAVNKSRFRERMGFIVSMPAETERASLQACLEAAAGRLAGVREVSCQLSSIAERQLVYSVFVLQDSPPPGAASHFMEALRESLSAAGVEVTSLRQS